MKNILKSVLLTLAMLAPSAGFAMEAPPAPIEAASSCDSNYCAICQNDDFESDAITLECHHSHTFHKDCITQWLRTNITCPTCRKEVSETTRTTLKLSPDERALIIACRDGNINTATALLNDDTNVNVRDTEGRAPLHFACLHGHLEIARLLISRGASVNAVTSLFGNTPLSYACEGSHLEIIRLLIDRGASVNAVTGLFGLGLTLLDKACIERRFAVAKLLLAHGAEATLSRRAQICAGHLKQKIAQHKVKIAAVACTLAMAYYFGS